MSKSITTWSRRSWLQMGLVAPTAWFTTRGAFAEDLVATPAMTEGPFYPDKLPLDTDNDLLVVNDSLTPAVGAITHLTGKVLGPTGAPLRNAFVEIWQVDQRGAYIHSQSMNRSQRDPNFQGYGRFLTDAAGSYYFRTIKPVAYPGRAPHIHVAVSQNGRRLLTTQMLVNGHPQNLNDNVFRGVRDPLARETLMVDFKPVIGSKLGELSAYFEIVLGRTPPDADDGQIHGGIGARQGDRGGSPR